MPSLYRRQMGAPLMDTSPGHVSAVLVVDLDTYFEGTDHLTAITLIHDVMSYSQTLHTNCRHQVSSDIEILIYISP